ncbi:MAG: hypothetical protein APF76_12705 [Desulfitibacter sp. BRH_c19]|nr:MAG: hypothetical protein APF76_12705 [Desulfitibacter sp. BRH_c19]
MEIHQDYDIREIKIEDVDYLYLLCKQLGYPVPQEDIMANVKSIIDKSDYIIYGAVLPEGKVIGCIQAHINRMFYSDIMIEVNGLIIDEKYRSQGIGEKLLRRVESFGKEKRCRYVNLRANVIRKSAHKFYEKLGYQNIKQQINYRKEI